MKSVQEFWEMGGYAAFVWSAYAVAALVVMANAVLPWLRHQRLLEELRRDAARERRA